MEENGFEYLTWRELKEAVNKLDEQFLDEKVRWWGDERGGVVYKIWILEEAYTNASGEGYEPLSGYDNEEEREEAREDGSTLEKGTPILQVD